MTDEPSRAEAEGSKDRFDDGWPMEKNLVNLPLWTQEESIAYECAREYISDLIGIYSQALSQEEARRERRQEEIFRLQQEIERLVFERRNLTASDHVEIARTRSEYGAVLQQHYSGVA